MSFADFARAFFALAVTLGLVGLAAVADAQGLTAGVGLYLAIPVLVLALAAAAVGSGP